MNKSRTLGHKSQIGNEFIHEYKKETTAYLQNKRLMN